MEKDNLCLEEKVKKEGDSCPEFYEKWDLPGQDSDEARGRKWKEMEKRISNNLYNDKLTD